MTRQHPTLALCFLTLLATFAPAGLAWSGEEDEEDVTEIAVQVNLEHFQEEDFEEELAHIDGAYIKLEETLLFHFAKTTIRRSSRATLSRVVDLLKAHPEITHVRIEGHTDFVGTEAFNQQLSEDRARVIRNFFVEHGVNPGRLSHVGYGEMRPRVEGTSGRKRQRNRRVEFVLTLGDGEQPLESRVPGLAEVIFVYGESVQHVSAESSEPLRQRQRLEPGAVLESTVGSGFVLRFEDLGRLTVETATRLKLVRLDRDPESEARTVAIKLLKGAIDLEDTAEGETVILTAEGSVTLRGAQARAERHDGATLLMVYGGEGRAETAKSSLDLEVGMAYRITKTIEVLGPLPKTPPRLMPTEEGGVSWDGASEGYRVEIASDPQFVSRHTRMHTPETACAVPMNLGPGHYIRVRPVAKGITGAPSPLYETQRGEQVSRK